MLQTTQPQPFSNQPDIIEIDDDDDDDQVGDNENSVDEMDQDESDDAEENDEDEVIEDEDESNVDDDDEEEEEEEELTVESLGKVNGIDSSGIFATTRTLQSSPGKILQPEIGLCPI